MGYLTYNPNHYVKENRPVGKEAIQSKAAQMKGGHISEMEIRHFIYFAFPLKTGT